MGASEKRGPHMKQDRLGQRYGKLTVVDVIRGRGFGTRWVCSCDCGGQVIASGGNLESGNTQSCGCSRRTHGLTGSRIYGAWKGMMSRCYRETTNGWEHYGGRGIVVCDRWHRFENFFDDMGHPPKGHSLDRINVNKNYEPDNCRWATYKVQLNNRRNCVYVTAFGRTQTMTQWAEEFGISGRTLHNRIKRSGIDPELALQQGKHDPLRVKRGEYSDRPNNRIVAAFGQKRTISSWARMFSVRVGTLREYIDKRGLAPEEAIRVAKMTKSEKWAYFKK